MQASSQPPRTLPLDFPGELTKPSLQVSSPPAAAVLEQLATIRTLFDGARSATPYQSTRSVADRRGAPVVIIRIPHVDGRSLAVCERSGRCLGNSVSERFGWARSVVSGFARKEGKSKGSTPATRLSDPTFLPRSAPSDPHRQLGHGEIGDTSERL
jgi:hypothetical protein